MKLFRALAATALLATLAAVPVSAADEASVRVLHASPDAPAVDVWLDGAAVDALTNVPFGAISDYLTIPAGQHQVQVFATGTTESPVIDAELDFAANTASTIAATNAVASIEAQVIVDDPAPSAAEAQVRIVHFSADAPAVDVAPDGGDPLAAGLAYPNASDYLSVPGGTYDLEVRLAGTTTVALQLDPVTVENGTAYSVFAIGSAADPAVGDNPLRVVVAVDGTAAPSAPEATMPPTDAIAPTPVSSAASTIGALLVMVGATLAAAGAIWFRRATAAR